MDSDHDRPGPGSYVSRRLTRRVPPLAVLLALAVLGPGSSSIGFYEDVGSDDDRHSTFHYELTRLLAVAAGFAVADADLIAVADEAVDRGNGFTGDQPDSPTVAISGTSRFDQDEHKYFHFPRRGASYTGHRDTCANFERVDPCPGGVAEVDALDAWAVRGTGALTIDVPEASVDGAPMAVVQPRTLVALGVFLHALADSYSHEKCGEVAHARTHIVGGNAPPSCTVDWHDVSEYGAGAAGLAYTREAGEAVWLALNDYREANGIGGVPAWSAATAISFVAGWAEGATGESRQAIANRATQALVPCAPPCSSPRRVRPVLHRD